MKPSHVALGITGLLVLSATVHSYATGALPGTNGTAGIVPNDVARNKGCGECHSGPTPSSVVLDINPGARTFATGASVSMNTKLSGGLMEPTKETWGGFINEVTDGSFTAGSSSQVDPSGKFITHNFAFLGGRDWSYTYNAPANPGVIELYAAANTVNGDGKPEGDMWAFHGDSTGQVSVPVRLYANSAGNVHHGDGCVGSFGNYPVLGAKEAPQVNNQNFAYEVHGAPVSTLGVLFIGADPAFHLPLDSIGVTSCTLHTNPLVNVPLGTSATGTTMRADGSATIPFPVPNAPILSGFSIYVQAALVDLQNGRGIALTMTNGLATTFQ